MIEIELNIDKIYKMPENIFIENIDGKTLVISSNTANWLLLNNDCQYRIFQSLAEGNSISQIFEIFKNCTRLIIKSYFFTSSALHFSAI